jgi:hypothetical protein
MSVNENKLPENPDSRAAFVRRATKFWKRARATNEVQIFRFRQENYSISPTAETYLEFVKGAENEA